MRNLGKMRHLNAHCCAYDSYITVDWDVQLLYRVRKLSVYLDIEYSLRTPHILRIGSVCFAYHCAPGIYYVLHNICIECASEGSVCVIRISSAQSSQAAHSECVALCNTQDV